ncbi:uncharacterized protein KGF55_003325 [Candida pseudojiufengensis]|uniref:uncharacterized protein n=1 Tax=Candida pseudojiufengensis TaxID=497109 RepID=UPI002224F7DC|nr:uncharacterized protein KGF55_003325 [Candida pseudojiufengensis]KAI5962249.1 hypothetical protein KGF55_003325 [Candida pseudojiufengensis]
MLRRMGSDVIGEVTVKEKTWCYFKLIIHPDPIIFEESNNSKHLLARYDAIEIDVVTWRTLIIKSLSKLYGLIGEASPFEIIKTENQSLNKTMILKIQLQDKDKFNNSLMSYTFNLNEYYNDLDLNCNIRIVKTENYIGLVI